MIDINSSCMSETVRREREGMDALTNRGELDRFYPEARAFVKMVGQGKTARSVFLVGSPGKGKSYMTLATLKECGLILDRDFCYLNTHVTPFGFYEYLYKHRNKKVVVVDDVDMLLRNRGMVPMLKALLDSPTGVRVVRWQTSRTLNVPKAFIFEGVLILCMNSIPNNIDVKAILDRGWVAQVEFEDKDLHSLIRAVAEKEHDGLSREDRWLVSEFILNNTTGRGELSLRTLVKGYDLFKYDSEKWKDILGAMI